MISAIYTCSPKRSRSKGSLLTYVILMLTSYSVGCVFLRFGICFDFIDSIYNTLLQNTYENGYFAAFFIFFLIKAALFLSVFFCGYFCLGYPLIYLISVFMSLGYGQLGGILYSNYSVTGVLIYSSCFLLFAFAVSVVLYYRMNDAKKLSSILFKAIFGKTSKTADFDNKDYIIKTILSLLIMIMLSLLQALVFKIVIFFAA